MNEFTLLIDAEIPRLRRYARALAQGEGFRADDLVQETLLRAVSKQHLWQPGSNLRAWLFTVMHNQYVNEVRRSVREGATVDVDKHCDRFPSISDPSASLLLRDLERALAKLPIERRQAILLVGLEGMSYEEAAQVLDIPIGTLRSRMSRGRAQLRHLMCMDADDDARSAPALPLEKRAA